MKVVSSYTGAARFDAPAARSPTPRFTLAALPEQAKPAWQRQQDTDRHLQLNRECSLQQVAVEYLARLQEQATTLLQVLEARGAVGSTRAIEQARQSLSFTLGQRVARVGEVLNAQLQPQAHARATFSVVGLASLASVQAAGAETLLFNVGRLAGGPIAVVLDDHMGSARLLRRLNQPLAQAGVQAHAGDDGQLFFSAVQAQWPQLRSQLAVRGEGRLFDGEAFVALQTREHSFKASLDSASDVDQLRVLARQALASVAQASEYFQHHQARLREQLPGDELRNALVQVLDFVDSAFKLPQGAGYDHASRAAALQAQINQGVAAQARIGRRTVLGLLG